MVELKVLRTGDAYALLLTDEVAAALGVKDGNPVEAEPDGAGGYRLSASDPEVDAAMAEMDDILARFPKTFEILSK